MSRLFIVSNRIGDLSRKTQTGGLAVAVAETFRTRGGTWIGWDGVVDREGAAQAGETVSRTGKAETVGVPLPGADYSDYYLGYSNSVLWPLLHYRADLVDYHPRYHAAYLRVNERFAKAVASRVGPDDIIWVHDYQLIPLAYYLRRLGCENRIGFFLHIPFPAPEVLAASPDHERTVDALLDYDLVGFQTHTDLANFHRYLETNELGTVEGDNVVRTPTRTLASGRFPISIDVAAFRKMALTPNDEIDIDRKRRNLLGRKLVVGVDRLDYTKGVQERFQAFRQMLLRSPDLERVVSMIQISPPTRENIDAYVDMREETERLAGSINGEFSDLNWSPIKYIHRTVARDKLAALLRASDVGLVTPLRDGMNLIAKEFVAAQDPDDPGVLVLSEFTGAAEEMKDALIVNPYDIEEMAAALKRALTMPLDERRRRHRALLDLITANDVAAWADGFLDRLRQDREEEAAALEDTRTRANKTAPPKRRSQLPPQLTGTVSVTTQT